MAKQFLGPDLQDGSGKSAFDTAWASLTGMPASISTIGGLTPAADKLAYYTGGSAAALTDLTSQARGLLDDTSYGAMRVTLGLAIGSDVQAYHAILAALAGLNSTAGLLEQTGASSFTKRLIGATNSTDVPTRADGDARWLKLAGGTMTGDLILNADATQALGAVTKQQLDSVAAGLDTKASARAATTANITLSGAQTIDGVSVVAGDRVLVKSQSTAAQNGIYVAASGAWSRSTDADAWAELPGAYVFVEEGTTNGDTGWTCTVNAGGTLGTTSVTWTQFAGAGTYTAGTGLSLSGTQFSLNASFTNISGSVAATQMPALTGDVTTSAGAVATTIANNAVTNAKAADMAVNTIKGRITTGTGDPEDLTPANVRTIINVADGATANSSDATLLARANHTGTQTASTISDFTEASQDVIGALLGTDTGDLDFTYDDAGNAESVAVKTDAIDNTKLANMAQATFKMRAAGAGTGDPIDGTPTQAKAALAIAASDVSGLAAVATSGAKADVGLGNVDNTSDATKNSATVTLTNKRVTPRVGTTASSSTPTPDADANDIYTVTALAAGATFGAPTGTPTDGQPLLIRIKDNGTARSLAFNAIYRAIGITLPSTTVISKTLYLGMFYNSADSKWDVLSTRQEA